MNIYDDNSISKIGRMCNINKYGNLNESINQLGNTT